MDHTQMTCPYCGSRNVIAQPVTETFSSSKNKTKGFGFIKACLGFFLFNVPGLLCGLCGMGKSKGRSKTVTNTKVVKVCQNCGRQF